MAIKDIEAVMEAAKNLSYDEWFKVSAAISRAFEEKEHTVRGGIKLDNSERIKYFYSEP